MKTLLVATVIASLVGCLSGCSSAGGIPEDCKLASFAEVELQDGQTIYGTFLLCRQPRMELPTV